jgi:hypothetical protein
VTTTDLTTLPVSAVPAAFDRGHLYSPTLALTRYALDDSYRYDYQPGDLYEPMPEAPREPKSFAWWSRNIAREPVPDFLGLREGDEITIQHATCIGTGQVIKTLRRGATVRIANPEGAAEPYYESWVSRRNHLGHWY